MWIRNEEFRPVQPESAVVAIVVLTSAAPATALAYFQALAQEAARDIYEFLRRRLKPGHSRPDHGIDHGDKEATVRAPSPVATSR